MALCCDIDISAAGGQMMLLLWLFLAIWGGVDGGISLILSVTLSCLVRDDIRPPFFTPLFLHLTRSSPSLRWFELKICASHSGYTLLISPFLISLPLPLFILLLLPTPVSPSLGWGLSTSEQTVSLCVARAIGAQTGDVFLWNLDGITIHRGRQGLQGLLIQTENMGEAAVRVKLCHKGRKEVKLCKM